MSKGIDGEKLKGGLMLADWYSPAGKEVDAAAMADAFETKMTTASDFTF